MRAQYIRVWVSLPPQGGAFYNLSLNMLWAMMWAHKRLLATSGRKRHPYDADWTDDIDLMGRVPIEWEAI